jgi:hypothetical protein
LPFCGGLAFSEQSIMVRKFRIVIVCALVLMAVAAAALWAAYSAARQVRPFYQQAMQLEPQVLERGRQELESRATTLYSDVRNTSKWQALFTDEQINGWLAAELEHRSSDEIHQSVREPRIAISPGVLTLGFTTTQSGVDTVVSVDAAVFLTEEGDISVRLTNVRAGTLPLPATLVADEIATACQKLPFPVLWTEYDGAPAAIIKIGHDESAGGDRFYLDAIELTEGQLFVAGHTEFAAPRRAHLGDNRLDSAPEIDLSDYELHLTPEKSDAMLEVARRPARGRRSAARDAGR